jgi:esterase
VATHAWAAKLITDPTKGSIGMSFSLVHDIRIGESSTRIRCAGTGKALLLLHDIGGSGASFAPMTSAIVAAGREAVAPDLPGFAQSDPVSGDLAEFAAHLQNVIDDAIRTEIDVVGRGFGGYLALTLAAAHSDRYSHVAVIDPITPPRAGAASSSRMSAGMALSGALTTVRRGRLLQNVTGLGRARSLLEQAAQVDTRWWDDMAGLATPVLLVDAAGARPDDRSRFGQLQDTVRGLAMRSTSSKATDDEISALVLEFIA